MPVAANAAGEKYGNALDLQLCPLRQRLSGEDLKSENKCLHLYTGKIAQGDDHALNFAEVVLTSNLLSNIQEGCSNP
jgi:hypothetical protein